MRATTLIVMLSLLIAVPAIARPPADRGYSGGSDVLEINGKTVFVSRLSGGNVVAEAVEESLGNDKFPGKHPGPTHVEPIVADLPVNALDDLLADFLSGANKTFSGSMITLNAEMRPVAHRQFENATIAEVHFDALDGSSKEPASVQVKIAPGVLRSVAPDAAPKMSLDAKRQKGSLTSNFRVAIPGVDCARVSRIEPIVITAGGNGGKISCANLVLMVSEAGAKDFVDWHRQVIIDGRTGPETEKTATIQLLSPNMKDVELTLEANGVGILAVRPGAMESGSESVRRVAVEMYVERWALKPAGGANAPATPAPEGSTPKPAPRKPR